MTKLARIDSSRLVQLTIASSLHHVPVDERWPVGQALAARLDDDTIRNLTLMTWYGIEPTVGADPKRAVSLIASTPSRLLPRFVARRIAAGYKP